MKNKRLLYSIIGILIIGFISFKYLDNKSREVILFSSEYEVIKKISEDHKDVYGGVFLDECEKRKIVIVKDISKSELKTINRYRPKVDYIFGEYNLSYLKEVYKTIYPEWMKDSEDNIIDLVHLSEENNRVEVYFNELNDENIARIKKIIDSDAIVFKEQYDSFEYH